MSQAKTGLQNSPALLRERALEAYKERQAEEAAFIEDRLDELEDFAVQTCDLLFDTTPEMHDLKRGTTKIGHPAVTFELGGVELRAQFDTKWKKDKVVPRWDKPKLLAVHKGGVVRVRSLADVGSVIT